MFAASKTNSASTGGYQISRSLRFNSADSAYLNRTPASASNRKTWTFSAWVKRGSVSTNQYFISNLDTGGASGLGVQFVSDGTLHIFDYGASNYVYELQTTAVFRDPSAWYHFVIAFDTTQATSSNRVKLYVNNVQQTSFSISSYPTLNYDGYWNNTSLSTISRAGGLSTQYFDGYVTETNFIDGQALTPSSFGETNAQTGVWQPKAFAGTYGTNGFYLNFSDNSNTTAATLGKDYSGNGNNWTPNNFSVTAGAGNDSLVDSPTSYGTDTGAGGEVRGNYATLNPLNAGNSAYLNNGNLAITNPSEGAWRTGVATIAMSSGKWYAEVTVTNNNLLIGIDKASVVFTGTTTFIGGSPTGWGVLYTGQVYNNSGVVYNNSSYAAGDIIGMTFDADTGVLTWYKNNVAMGQTITGLTSGPYVFGFSANSAGNGSINFGQRPFAYTAPSGFKALCTQNLPTPTIGATTATQANLYFTPTLFTGTGSSRVITTGMQSDFIWTKSRSQANDNMFFDVVRGISRAVRSNSTSAESYDAGYYVTSFNSDGYNIGGSDGALNNNGQTYVSWTWKANGSGSTNTAGSITSTVSANTTSGFSVVTYTGNGSNATVGHGLGVAPSMIIGKARNNTYAWRVYHTSIGAANFLVLNATDASASGATWNSTTPTSTVFTVGGGSNMNVDSSTTYVAYCFAPIAGYSAFGSYTGNGSTDGPFIYCGFRPAYVMFKNASVSGSWEVYDTTRNTYNTVDNYLLPNVSDAEGVATNRFDYLSNGVKVRNTGGSINGSGNTIIFMAFASNPFKYSLAR